jgi:lipopolysaccharide transport system ATP-binding protein
MFDDGTVSLTKHSINNNNNTTLQRGDDLLIELEMEFKKESLNVPLIYIEFRDKEQRPIAGVFNEKMSYEIINDKLFVKIKIPKVLFAQGIYSYDLSVNHFENKSPILRINNVDAFQIESETEMWVPFHLEADWQINGKTND